MRVLLPAILLACGSTQSPAPPHETHEPDVSTSETTSASDTSASDTSASETTAADTPMAECARVADTWVVERGSTCIVGIDTSRIRAYPSCGSEFVEVYFSADMRLLIRGMEVGCYLWQYIDRDGEPQSAEFCVGPDIGTGRPCGH